MTENRSADTIEMISDQYEAKLASHGLTPEDAETLGIEFLDAEQTAALPGIVVDASHRGLPSMHFRYFDPDTGEPMRDRPHNAPFFQVRFLGWKTTFGEVEKGKYKQPVDTMPCAYYPRTVPNWPEILEDESHDILITEGAPKAACACKHGVTAVGICGVEMWHSPAKGHELIPSLERVVWKNRKVNLCFDGDIETNDKVRLALIKFADVLESRGALPHILALPKVPGVDKVGLDDFILSLGNTHKHRCDALGEFLQTAEPLAFARALHDFNKRFVVVRHPLSVVDLRSGDLRRMKPADFEKSVVDKSLAREPRKDGGFSYKSLPVAGRWLKWQSRREVSQIVFAPGEPEFTVKRTGNAEETALNYWRGYPVTPVKGDVTPFLRYFDHIFEGINPPEAKRYALQWLAYPFQNPMKSKMPSALVLHGRQEGTGKSTLGRTMRELYGARHYCEVTQRQLQRDFNEYLFGRQLIMCDDLTSLGRDSEADLLKVLISQETVNINNKHEVPFDADNRVNFIFTSNRDNFLLMADTSRRFLVHEVTCPILPQKFWDEYYAWLYGGGAAHLMHYFMYEVDLSGFNPYERPLQTAAMKDMIDNSEGDLGLWVREFIQGSPSDLVLPRRMEVEYNASNPPKRYGSSAISTVLRKHGARSLGTKTNFPDAPGRDGSHLSGRYYSVRNHEKWATARNGEVVKHVLEHDESRKRRF